MKRTFVALIICSWLLTAAAKSVAAHDGGHGEAADSTRTWQLSDGTHVHATFVDSDQDMVRLLTADGQVDYVAIAQLSGRDRIWIARQLQEKREMNLSPKVKLLNFAHPSSPPNGQPARPSIADSFTPFEDALKVRWDKDFLLVESNGIPDHPMMIGIRSWQQQVPLPQPYYGGNAWRIPLHPQPAQKPVSTKGQFLRGAIALAVNGIPIFNPLNNRGDDAYLFGELDEFGGHCGRADDYHYHLAPVHLEKIVGAGKPIAYALDGYPILGYQDPKSPDYAPLDWMGGHKDKDGNYHYHATEKYPYLNGGFYGQVVERDGQVDPQPRAEPIRPALPPLKGAKVTGFEQRDGTSTLTYDVQGRSGTVEYTESKNGTIDFVFTDPTGKTKRESYRQRVSRDGERPRGGRARTDGKEKQSNSSTPAARKSTEDDANEPPNPSLTLSSKSVDAQGFLSIDCTCDGKRQSPAIAWENLPEGTKFLAVTLWHTAPDKEKSYWLVYNIPASTAELPQNASNTGTIGVNDRKRPEYDPMCSKGPGLKVYHITVIALSQMLDIKPNQMDRQRLLEEAKKYSLGETTLDFKYER